MAKKILMVCLGNICRSPLAEGILKSKAADLFEVDSAGTSAFHQGEKADQRSIYVALKNNVDISDQRSRKLTKQDLEYFDLIFAMDMENYNNISAMAENEEQRAKVKLIMNEVYPNSNLDVPDPYYGGQFGFENVYQMLDMATDKIIEKYSK